MKRTEMSVVFATIGLSIVAVVAVKAYRDFGLASSNNLAGKLAFCVVIVGLLGFSEGLWIHLLPREFLEHFELPNTLGSVRLIAPDGRVFIVSPPMARVQRYGPEGFEKGFSYEGKAFKFGMSMSGDVLICSQGKLIAYDPDGAEVLPRGVCPLGADDSSPHPSNVRVSYPSNAKVPTIAFNWFSAHAVPLWHPVAGWLVAAFGFLVIRLSSPGRTEASGNMAGEQTPST
jgi:hypothetical protein